MKRGLRNTIAFISAFMIAFTGAFMFNGNCEVAASENTDAVWLINNGEKVSGKTLTLKLATGEIQFSAESSADSDTFSWGTVDDA